ncbi:MAG: serpin family protein [Bacteroidales bacterium]|nr:serpin family protein [Bacteroidales bacterium]
MKKTLILLMLIFQFSGAIKSQNKEIIVDNNNRFAIDLYKELKGSGENLIFSPFSISSAMAMTYAGAENNTAKEFQKTLFFLEDKQLFHQEYSHLFEGITNGKKNDVEFYNANSLWIQKNFNLKEEFLDINKKYYSSALFYTDFYQAQKAANEINGWVEKNTRNKITNLLQPSALSSDTRLVLINALYFKGEWNKPFREERNSEEKFTISRKEEVTTTFMNGQITTWYYKDCLKEIIEIPYADRDYSMMIILPKNYRKLKWVERFLSVKCMERYEDKKEKYKVNVSVPKFKMGSEFNLKEVFQALGMQDAFAGSADFSGMTEETRLYIDEVIHKAIIDVNEAGTEAAAATAVVMRKTSVLMENVTFKADRPFIYAIRNTRDGTIYFLGKVMNPEK